MVTDSIGDAHLVRGDGYYAIARGIDVEEGDLIQTALDAEVQVEMDDGSILEIGEDSEFYIGEYRLREDKSVELAAVSLVKGWLRFVTAKLQRSRRYDINTQVATIGLRGTEGVLLSDRQTTRFLLNEGEVDFIELSGAGALGAATLVRAGEFVERASGRPLAKQRSAPGQFLKVIPGRFKSAPKRLKAALAQRGLKPKILRAVRDDDLKQIRRSNPRIKQKLKGRFGDKMGKLKQGTESKSSGKRTERSNRKDQRKTKQQKGKKGGGKK